MWHCSLYRVTYCKDDKTYEVLMPVSDWLVRMATEKHETHWVEELRSAYLDTAKRVFKGAVLDPAGLKGVSFEPVRKAKLSDIFKSITHKQLTA